MNALATDRTPTAKQEGLPSLLICDGDRVSARAIEAALTADAYAIEWARDGEAALDIMQRTRVDLMIADTVLSDVSGITLLRRAHELRGPAAPAFVFVSIDTAVTSRVSLLRAGAADYIIKPFVNEELRARVDRALQLKRAPQALMSQGVSGLSGSSDHVLIPDLLTMLEFARRSGIIDVSVGAALGRLWLDAGRVVHAELGTLRGADAFFAIMRQQGGMFRYLPQDLASEFQITMNAKVSELLMEAAVQEDTERHVLGDATRAPARAPTLVRVRHPSNAPSALLPVAARVAVGLADPFTIGDLQLTSDFPVGAKPEVRIELWTSVPNGVAMLLNVASPPGQQVLQAALTGRPESLHLIMDLPQASVVVSLVDCERGASVPSIAPHVLILMPTRGELLTLAPQRLAEFTARASAPGPLGVVAVGGPGLQETVSRIVRTNEASLRLTALPSHEGEFRELLTAGFAQWIAAAKRA